MGPLPRHIFNRISRIRSVGTASVTWLTEETKAYKRPVWLLWAQAVDLQFSYLKWQSGKVVAAYPRLPLPERLPDKNA